MIDKNATPRNIRQQARQEELTSATSGLAVDYIQANLVMMPKIFAAEYLKFCTHNQKACPVLEALDPGKFNSSMAKDSDLRTDLPKYHVYRHGVLEQVCTNIVDIATDDLVSFLIGCSFSFEHALMDNAIPVRNIQEDKNVSMYITNRQCQAVQPFSSPLVVSMRPIANDQIDRAVEVTSRFTQTHGAPVQIGHPEALGIADINKPDFGDPVKINANETPLFWACGVTAILAATSFEQIPLVITHSPGCMFVTDVRSEDI